MIDIALTTVGSTMSGADPRKVIEMQHTPGWSSGMPSDKDYGMLICPSESQLTCMIDIALTAEFAIADGGAR